ncbi:MAG: cyclic nucleotide-binding domain-containing protein [Deltaproteobacteria bacterium]|nr:cyclic nucleotide-binding domain-containing protein [Deltaproteobacteria bacterium]
MHWRVRVDFLTRVEIFSGLGRRDLKALAKSCSESSYAEGETICRQGERGVAAFLIVSGRVRVEEEMEGGRVVPVAEIGQGAVVGELSVIDGAERVATLRAVGEVDCLVLTQWSMLALLRERPSIAAAMLPVVIKRFRDTTRELRLKKSDSIVTRDSIMR